MKPRELDTIARAKWQRARETEERLAALVFDFAVRTWGPELLEAAASLLGGHHSARRLERLWPMSDPWFAFMWRPRLDASGFDPIEWPMSPLAEVWANVWSGMIAEFDRQFISAAASSPWSMLLVERGGPGSPLALRDLLTGRSFHVVDPEISSQVRRSDILMSGVVTLDGITTLLAPAPWTVPVEWCFEAADLRHAYADGEWQQRAELLGMEFELFDEYLAAMERRPSVCRGPDAGDALHVEWTITMAFEPALERLRPLSEMYDDEEFSLELRPDGTARMLLAWYELQSDDPDDYDLMAHLFLDDGFLSAEVSTRQYDRLVGAIEGLFGAAAQLVTCRSAAPVRVHQRRSRLLPRRPSGRERR